MQSNSVSSATKPPSLTPAQLPEELLKQSVSEVVHQLTGQKVSEENVANLKLSEDLLYTAVIHQRIEERYPGIGNQLLTAVGAEYRENVKNLRRQPLKLAVDHFLHSMVRNRQISNNSKESLMHYAFGKSQLDGNNRTLARKPENQVNAQPLSPGKTSLDLALTRANENRVATKQEAKAFNDKITRNRKLTSDQAAKQAGVLSRIFPTQQNPVPPSSETDKSGPLPDPKKIATGPNDFAYKPESEIDGKMVFILPQRYRDRALSASIFALDRETKLADLKTPRYGDDNRPYFRSEQNGKELDGSGFLRINLVDGSEIEFHIPDFKSFYMQQF